MNAFKLAHVAWLNRGKRENLVQRFGLGQMADISDQDVARQQDGLRFFDWLKETDDQEERLNITHVVDFVIEECQQHV